MPKVTLKDVEIISTRPRVGKKIFIDDWHILLRFENHKWIHSFEWFDDGEWSAPLTSRGYEIIKQYEKNKFENIDDIDEFLKPLST